MSLIRDLTRLYEKIYQIDSDKISTSWNQIAKLMNDHSSMIKEVFFLIKADKAKNEINLDYSMDQSQLHTLIMEETNQLIKTSYIITSLHNIFYRLMSTEGNYYFALNGKEEMDVLKKDLIYYINISTKIERNIYFHAFILLFALETLFNRHFYLCVDFEYTNHKIQLAQLNFEHNIALESFVEVISPTELADDMLDTFINLIICNKYLRKILHGADSLDIPYIYEHLLGTDLKKFTKFNKAVIDTRFLCEYYKLSRGYESDNRCSIYDVNINGSAIYYFKVVNREQQDRLASMIESLPHHREINWNIHNLDRSQIRYTVADVEFLKWFYFRIIYVATTDEESDRGKKNIIDLYKHVLAELTRFVYLDRYSRLSGNITLMMKCKEDVDVANNYFIKTSTGIKKMIDIFKELSVGLESTDPKVNIDKLIKVNHFKMPVLTLVKRIIYGHISTKCRVQKDKNTIWKERLSNQFIFDSLNQMGYNYSSKMFIDLSKTLEVRVKMSCE